MIELAFLACLEIIIFNNSFPSTAIYNTKDAAV